MTRFISTSAKVLVATAFLMTAGTALADESNNNSAGNAHTMMTGQTPGNDTGTLPSNGGTSGGRNITSAPTYTKYSDTPTHKTRHKTTHKTTHKKTVHHTTNTTTTNTTNTSY